MRRPFLHIGATIILAPLCLYFGYQILFPTYTYRYRLSVEVDTPDGLRSGSSVIEVRYEKFPELLTDRDHISRVIGEAVFVDLGRGKNLIGLLASGPTGEDVDYSARIILQAFGLDGNDPSIGKRLSQLHGKREFDIAPSNQFDVSKRFLPTFVTFRNLADVKSVEIAPPGLFGEVFGDGYGLRNVSIEMTDQRPTEKIQKMLPWLPHPTYLNGGLACGPGDPTYCLHGGHFMRTS